MKIRSYLPAFATALGVLFLFALWAATACHRPATTPTSSPASVGSEGHGGDGTSTSSPASVDTDDRTAPAPELVPTASTGESASARALASLPSSDARMLAQAERAVGGDPPPVFRELVRERSRGATRETLEARIRASLTSDLALRRIALEWLDEVLPDPTAPRPSTVPADHGLGAGGRSPTVQPLEVVR